MKAAFGKVFQVRDVPSSGVTRLIIELPIEAHRELTNEFYSKDVLVTLSPKSFGRYGMVESAEESTESDQEATQNETVGDSEPKGGFLSQWLAMRNSEPEFWRFIDSVEEFDTGYINSAKMCDKAVKYILGIESKKELDSDKEAEARFHSMIRLPYADWLRGVR